MSFHLRSSASPLTRTGLPLTAAAAALALAACGGDEAGSDAGSSSQAGAQGAGDALAALGLAEQGRATWAGRSRDGDTYTFTEFTLATDEGQLSAEMLVLTDPRLTDDGPVFERLSLNDGELTYADGLAGFSAFSISDAGPGVGQAVANLINGEGGFDDIPLEQQTFSELTLDTLRVRTEASEEAGPGELVIARAEAGGFDGERLERFSLTDLAYDATAAEGGQLALDIEDVAATGVNVALFQSGAAGEMASNPLLSGASAGLDQYESFAVKGLRLVSGAVRVRMSDFTAEIEEGRRGALISTAAMPSLILEPNPDSPQGSEFVRTLDQLGYEAMRFSFASETEYDPGADRVTTTGENYLAMEDGFTMTFEQDVSGIDAYATAYQDWLASGGDADTAPPAEVLAPLMIHSALIRLEDRSLLDRALSLMAERQGVTPAELRAQAGLFVAMGAAMAAGSVPGDLMSQISTAMTSFVGQGGALVIAFEPDEPVSAARFVNEGETDLSGVSVRHEPAE
ncbi:MAG: hypothetical protein ACFE0P_08445 [Oceanicaulis sp.]